jgi:hypothetical protein
MNHKRERDNRDDEGKPIKAQRHDAGDDGGGGERPAAHLGKRQRREQPHGADHDQRARIPEQVRRIEFRHRHRVARRRRLPLGEECNEPSEIGGADYAGRLRGAKILFRIAHRCGPIGHTAWPNSKVR